MNTPPEQLPLPDVWITIKGAAIVRAEEACAEGDAIKAAIYLRCAEWIEEQAKEGSCG